MNLDLIYNKNKMKVSALSFMKYEKQQRCVDLFCFFGKLYLCLIFTL